MQQYFTSDPHYTRKNAPQKSQHQKPPAPKTAYHITKQKKPPKKPQASENPKHTQHALTPTTRKKQHSPMHKSENKPLNPLPKATKNPNQPPNTTQTTTKKVTPTQPATPTQKQTASNRGETLIFQALEYKQTWDLNFGFRFSFHKAINLNAS